MCVEIIRKEISKGNFKKVIEIAEKLKSEKNINSGELSYFLGMAYDQLSLTINNSNKKGLFQKKALINFRKAIKFNLFSGVRGIGNVYLHKGNYKKAIDYYKKALQTSLNKSYTYNDLGNACKGMAVFKNDGFYFRKAINFYKKSIGLASDFIATISPTINISLIYQKLGDMEKSVKYAEKALKMINKLNNKDFTTFYKWKNELKKIIDMNN